MPIKIFKPIGFTPLELINDYKKKYNINKLSFAGRLDPMACGLMLLLEGDECKKQLEYCGKDKIYEFKILYGFKTDSLDILGFSKIIDLLEFNYKDLLGKSEQKYPIYSSKTLKINGITKPLWYWEKKGLLNYSLIPKKGVEVYKIEKNEVKEYSNYEIKDIIFSRISKLSEENKVKFRYFEIKKMWEENLGEEKKYKVETFRARVSSGTYIRGLCEKMGGVAFDINRIDIIF
jgi:tRNA U55 pseudouridine synthase TruB